MSATDAIGIIGGGASGLAAARALRELGYRHITVLERERSVGGKCCTLVHDGRTYELGAVLVTPAYRRVRALMREVGVRASAPAAGFFAGLRNWTGTGTAPWPRRWTGVGADGVRFVREMARHRMVFRPGFAGWSEELAAPFEDWCRASHCPAVSAVVEPWVTAFGYGVLREVPAAYVLKYATLFAPPVLEILHDGYGGLFQRLAAALPGVDIRLGARVTSVVRGTTDVTVRTTDGTMVFDALIVACPLDEALGFLDATAMEVDLFERVRYRAYFVLGASVSGRMPRTRYLFLPENFEHTSVGRPLVAYRRWRATDVVFFYGFVGETDGERAARREVAIEVDRLGGRLEDIVAFRRWRYFPHVQSDDLAGGYYRRLEALQGARRTYYCGEILAFAAVETVVDYADALVRRYFSPAP
jgi:predicted NAD/FAD-binding protein